MSAAIAGLTLWTATVADAQWHGSLAYTTDYPDRGYTKTNGGPSVQANLDYEHGSGWYGGIWVSSVDFADRRFRNRANVEWSPYLGRSMQLAADWRAELQASGYVFDGDFYGRSAHYAELYGFLHFREIATLQVGAAPDAYGGGEETVNVQVTGRYALSDTARISAGLGHYWAEDVFNYDYLYWNVGGTWFHRYGGLDLRYFGTTQFEPSGGTWPAPGVHPEEVEGVVLTLTIGF
jgi:uncharacterized protein (TIGR02001 family)